MCDSLQGPASLRGRVLALAGVQIMPATIGVCRGNNTMCDTLPLKHLGGTGHAAQERQDLPCTYLAHHQLESALIAIVIKHL